MKESEYRENVVKWLKPLMAFPVENVATWGAPDVCCLAGWIELKKADKPSRDDTIVRPGMRATQRIWHKKWSRGGGLSWALTIMSDDRWFLHSGAWAAEFYDRSPLFVFEKQALIIYDGPPGEKLVTELLHYTRRRSE